MSNAGRKIGTRINSNLNGDSLIINNGVTASTQFLFEGGTDLVFYLPTTDGSDGDVLVTDGTGVLSWQTVAGGLTYASGSTPSITKWTGSQSIGNSVMEEVGNQIFFPSGVANEPGIVFLNDGDTGIFRIGANNLGIAAGGTEVASHKVDEHYFNVDSGDQIYISSGDGISLFGPASGTTVTGSFSNPTNVSANEVVITDASGYFVSTPLSTFIGPTGAQGPTGPQGIQGDTGATGPQGAQGVQGIQGEMGATGPQGVQGIQGQSGATATGLFAQRAGMIEGPSFSGTPLTYQVTFTSSYTASYVVTVDSPEPRDWTITDKDENGFIVNSNSIMTMTYSTYWVAVSMTSDNLGAIEGPQGIQGIQGPTGPQGIQGVQGIQGPTGSQGIQGIDGPTGPTGPQGNGVGVKTPLQLTDASTISWTYSSGFNAYVTITGNRSISITTATAGDYGTLLITQGGAGSFRINFATSSNRFPGTTYSFTPTTGRTDVYGFYYDGNYFYWSYNLNYY